MLNIHFIRQKQQSALGQSIHCYGQYKTLALGIQTVLIQDVNKYEIVGGIFIEVSIYKVKDLVEKTSLE